MYDNEHDNALMIIWYATDAWGELWCFKQAGAHILSRFCTQYYAKLKL